MSVDFVIITALKEEQEALIAKFPPVQRLPPTDDDVHVYYRTELPVTLFGGATGTYTLILLSIMGMTREKAAIFTSDALHRWHPRYVLLVGIAGGMADAKVARGDVLISEQIVDYEHQKITAKGEREHRWEVHRGDPRLLEASRNLGDGWRMMIRKRRPEPGRPKPFFGPIATGDKVVDYLPFLSDLLSYWPKIIGVEMESGGVASAAFQAANAAGFFMIRGVSDLAENKDDAWRQYACHTAAAYVLALLQSGPVPLAVPVASKTIEPSEPADTIRDLTSQKPRPSTNRLPRKISPLVLRLSLVLIVLLALAGVGGRLFFTGYYLPVQQHAIATATDRSIDTVTARNNTILAAGLVANNPYPPSTGTLQLKDTLQKNTDNLDWITGNFPNLGSCIFIEGAYHLEVVQNGQFIYCSYKTFTFSNFAYQAQVTILKGGWGGLSFRSPGGGSLYYFQIDTQGNYQLDVNKNHNFLGILVSGTSRVIKTGFHQTNLLGVVARGNSFDLYVNHQYVAHGNDATFSSGLVGVIANYDMSSTEVMFQDAEVWKL